MLGIALSMLACMAINVGCVQDKSANRLYTIADAQSHADTIVRDTRAEVTALRHDLATARVTLAKQEATAADLRREIELLQTERAELRRMVNQTQSALTSLQDQREQLKEGQVLPQAVSALSARSVTLTEAREDLGPSDMRALESRLTMLSNEFMRLKARLSPKSRRTVVKTDSESDSWPNTSPRMGTIQSDSIRHKALPISATEDSTPESAASSSGSSARIPESHHITVSPGASLWILARNHGVTVDELKKANGLKTNVVHAGQRLVIPQAAPTEVYK